MSEFIKRINEMLATDSGLVTTSVVENDNNNVTLILEHEEHFKLQLSLDCDQVNAGPMIIPAIFTDTRSGVSFDINTCVKWVQNIKVGKQFKRVGLYEIRYAANPHSKDRLLCAF